MSDDVGVLTLAICGIGQIEANSHASRASVGIIIWDIGNAGGVGEANGDGRGVGSEVMSLAQRGGYGGRCESARQENATSVGRAEVMWSAKGSSHGREESLGCFVGGIIGGERHLDGLGISGCCLRS